MRLSLIATILITTLFLPPNHDGLLPPDLPPPTPLPDTLALTDHDHPWESLIQIYFEPEDWQWARDVIGCETGYTYDETERNPISGAAGLWQFIPSTWEFSKPWEGASPYDPTAAFMAARWLHDQPWGGRSQWECSAIMGY